MQKYDVILADPPWSFSAYNEETAQKHVTGHYSTMSIPELCELPIRDLAAENCALFMWVTWPNLQESFNVIESWGFTYRTIGFLWAKAKKSGMGFFTGMGYYGRSNTEACLLAVKGRMKVSVHDVLSLIYSPVREHSRKPDEQYQKIERLYPNMRYLELFARRKRSGWHSWGNEIESDVVLYSGCCSCHNW